MSNNLLPNQACATIREHIGDFTPRLGIILGSGLSDIAAQITDKVEIPYADIPGYPRSQVDGHGGYLVCGRLNDLPVACLHGRYHYYEGGDAATTIKTMIRSLKLLGCEELLITNASGSLNPDVGPGGLMLIRDHINFSFNNPLVGPNDHDFGPRFPPMADTYNPRLCTMLHGAAKQLQIPLTDGTYMGVLGPNFETPAEIRAFRLLGADAIGMSTVPDVLIARHCGLKLALISAITNLASGMSDEQLSHEGTLKYGKIGAQNLIRIVSQFSKDLADEV